MTYKPVIIGVGLGATAGLLLTAAATTTHSYVAAYSLVWAGALGALLLTASVLFLVAKKTRRLAAPTAICAVTVVLSCWGSFAAAAHLGAWNEPMVEFGPHVPARFVVVFQHDVTESEINGFIEQVLSDPHPNRGMSLKAPISSLLRVSVDQHAALALQLRTEPPGSDQLKLEQAIERHPSVHSVLRDVVPESATLDGT